MKATTDTLKRIMNFLFEIRNTDVPTANFSQIWLDGMVYKNQIKDGLTFLLAHRLINAVKDGCSVRYYLTPTQSEYYAKMRYVEKQQEIENGI